jgi:hypothetical protein
MVMHLIPEVPMCGRPLTYGTEDSDAETER